MDGGGRREEGTTWEGRRRKEVLEKEGNSKS